jgi:hypothetical protein
VLIGNTGENWTSDEVEAVVDAYFALLANELRGERPRKSDIIKRLQTSLTTRSSASIERKMQNISAVLDEEQYAWLDGYKPLAHYQLTLRDAMLSRLTSSRRLAETLAEYQANTLAAPTSSPPALEDVLVPSPSRLSHSGRRGIGITAGPVGALQDYRNRQLGTAGEEWVLELERETLGRAGRSDLASQVVWVAKEVGDGAGYDISSFRPNGDPLMIEVKTTNLGVRTPFFVTRWEVEVSARISSEYSLYRVFDFRAQPHLYRLEGSISASTRLVPTVFLGLPN